IWNIIGKAGLCHTISKIVNLPVNKVQEENSNWSMEAYDTKQLLDIFNDGMKMDIFPLFRAENSAGHHEYDLTFIPRG
ncbi:hypothetical protein KAH94_00125, partial [bacterium]|nr:hypothetical protein [bacterium]